MKGIEKFKVKEHIFVINNNILTVSVNNKEIKLTQSEFCIFHYLIHHQNMLISKRDIDIRVLNLRLDRDGNVCCGFYSTYSHIAALRRALNKIIQGLGNIIVTRPRFGYYISTDDYQYQS